MELLCQRIVVKIQDTSIIVVKIKDTSIVIACTVW